MITHPEYKIGDMIRVKDMNSGLTRSLIDKIYKVVNIDNIYYPKPYLGVDAGLLNITYIYLTDIELAKPKIELGNFKQYMKTKMAANVAVV